jgi:hypothetical protein
MRYNEVKSNANIFHSNARAEDGYRGYRQEYSVFQTVIVPLGVIAAIFLIWLLVTLTS